MNKNLKKNIILQENNKKKKKVELETHISSSWCEISERVYEIMEIEDCARD
jgi:hypothetical protein